jgi:hypothetical protein
MEALKLADTLLFRSETGSPNRNKRAWTLQKHIACSDPRKRQTQRKFWRHVSVHCILVPRTDTSVTPYPDPTKDGGFDPASIPFGGPYPPTRNLP